jgi:hypothetical protein
VKKLDPEGSAQRQLDAYNDRDLDRFVREYADDVVVYRLPDLHAKLVNRMVFGNKVIDQELVTGVPNAPLEVAAIYEVTEKGISKVWFVNGARS